TCQNERGTMAMVTRGPLKDVYFGFNVANLLLRLDFYEPARDALAEFDALRVGFVEPAGYELVIERPASSRRSMQLLQQGKPMSPAGVEVGIDRIAGLALPFDLLGIRVDEPLQFYVDLRQGGQSLDRAPREGTIALVRPSPDFERIMWDV